MSTITLKKQTIIIFSILTIALIALSAIIGYSLNNKPTKIETQKVVEVKPVTEIKQVSEPLKMAIAEEVKKKEDIKTVLTPEETKKVETKVAEKTKLEYTNPYFPTLKLSYTSDWNFDTNTSESYDPGLLSREITITKDKTRILINLYPVIQPQCGGGVFNIKSEAKISNFVTKAIVTSAGSDFKDESVIYYPANGNIISCPDKYIQSNIPKSSYPIYIEKSNANLESNAKSNSNVIYAYTLRVLKTDPSVNENYDPILPTDSNLSEIETLLKGFQF